MRLIFAPFTADPPLRTRAREMLILATREGQPSAWLDLLGALWLRPLEDAGIPVSGLLGPSQVPYCTRTIQPSAAIERPKAATSHRWFLTPVLSTSRLPALIVPSRQPLIVSAKEKPELFEFAEA